MEDVKQEKLKKLGDASQRLKKLEDARKDKLDKLEGEHGPIARVPMAGEDYHFRKPTLGEYNKFHDTIGKDKTPSRVPSRELVMACSVGEDPKPALDTYPAAVQQIALALADMAGSEVEIEVSKG